MKPSGIQLIGELSGCPTSILNNKDELQLILLAGIKQCGLSCLNTISHKFDPMGVTLISIIKESHIAIHTFPEAQHVSIDIFHCSTDIDPHLSLMEFLREKLQARNVNFIEIVRGERFSLKTSNFNNDKSGFDLWPCRKD